MGFVVAGGGRTQKPVVQKHKREKLVHVIGKKRSPTSAHHIIDKGIKILTMIIYFYLWGNEQFYSKFVGQ